MHQHILLLLCVHIPLCLALSIIVCLPAEAVHAYMCRHRPINRVSGQLQDEQPSHIYPLQVVQAYARLLAKKEEVCVVMNHARLRHLLEINIKMQCWDQAAALCQQLAVGGAVQEGQAADLSQLSALSSVLTDKLAVDVETAASVSTSSVHIKAALLLPKLHSELSAYRSQLLLSEACLSSTSLLENFDQVAQLCQPIQDTLESRPQHMLSLFTSMQALVKQQEVVLSQLQGQSKSVSCTLQPVHLRLADLISLFCPQYRQACSHLMEVQRSVQHAMSKAQQISKLDYDPEVFSHC